MAHGYPENHSFKRKGGTGGMEVRRSLECHDVDISWKGRRPAPITNLRHNQRLSQIPQCTHSARCAPNHEVCGARVDHLYTNLIITVVYVLHISASRSNCSVLQQLQRTRIDRSPEEKSCASQHLLTKYGRS